MDQFTTVTCVLCGDTHTVNTSQNAHNYITTRGESLKSHAKSHGYHADDFIHTFKGFDANKPSKNPKCEGARYESISWHTDNCLK